MSKPINSGWLRKVAQKCDDLDSMIFQRMKELDEETGDPIYYEPHEVASALLALSHTVRRASQALKREIRNQD